jgi:hypothetical protein
VSETGAAGGAGGDGDNDGAGDNDTERLDGAPVGAGPHPPDSDPMDAGPLDELGGEDEFYEFPPGDGEDVEEEYGEPHTALPGKVEAWRRRSATGAILTGFALGLQQVFEPKKDDPAVIMETSGEPPKDLPVEADFEYGRPKQSVVNVRPWLLPGAHSDSVAGEQPADGPQGSENRPDSGKQGA